MKKCLPFLCLFLLPAAANASVEWSLRGQINLEAAPLETVTAIDGKTLYFLIPGKIVSYSLPEKRVIDFMPVERRFDHLCLADKGKVFVLSSSKDKSVSVFERKKIMDISGLPYKGLPDAPVVVAVFSDYQCPYCGRLEPLLQQVLEKYPKTVKLVFKNFPMSFHPAARKAATAALAAEEQGKFWEFGNKLFASGNLSDDKILEIAKELRLDPVKFTEKLKDPSIQRTIDRDIADGQDTDVRGTPTIFINGKELRDTSLQGFAKMIEAELR